MSDNLNYRGPKDRTRVNVHEAWEVRYWCGEFNCTEATLRRAVAAVGVMVTDVRAYIAKHR
jgi:hypothetical protein